MKRCFEPYSLTARSRLDSHQSQRNWQAATNTSPMLPVASPLYSCLYTISSGGHPWHIGDSNYPCGRVPAEDYGKVPTKSGLSRRSLARQPTHQIDMSIGARPGEWHFAWDNWDCIRRSPHHHYHEPGNLGSSQCRILNLWLLYVAC